MLLFKDTDKNVVNYSESVVTTLSDFHPLYFHPHLRKIRAFDHQIPKTPFRWMNPTVISDHVTWSMEPKVIKCEIEMQGVKKQSNIKKIENTQL